MLIEEIFANLWKDRGKVTIFFLGILMTLVAFLVSFILFQREFLPIVFFTTLTLVPFVNIVFKEKLKNSDLAILYLNLFLGMILVFTVLNLFIDINEFVSISANIGQPYVKFSSILMHNTKLVFTSFLLSILFGVGAIFVITLNAAVMGQMFSTFLAANKIQYLLAFLPHTLIELVAYLMAAISGGILITGLTNYEGKDFQTKMLKAATFFSLSITAIIIGAFVESFIMPILVVL